MGNLYLVTYDMRVGATMADYERISDAVRALGGQRVQFSVWALRSTQTADALCRYLMPTVDGNDRLMVAAVADWSAYNNMVDLNTL